MTSFDQQLLRVMSGESRSLLAAALRSGLAVLEPAYRLAIAARNKAYDCGLRSTHPAGRPVVSVGNLTTGGTGKTPVVAWLADALRRELAGEIAILMRGYKSCHGHSDEAMLLRNRLGGLPAIHVTVSPDRVAAAKEAIRTHAGIRAFIMDDGFQHRRLRREFDLILVDATNPFGFEHVLPRGLLREPVASLRRANAVLITRADQAGRDAVERIVARVRVAGDQIPIFESSHQIVGFRQAGSPSLPIESMRGKRIAAFAGIGNPAAFEDALRRLGLNLVARQWFGDHHAYDASSMSVIAAMAREHRAEALITTEKDAVKLPDGGPVVGVPVFVAQLQISFAPGHEDQMLSVILNRLRGATD